MPEKGWKTVTVRAGLYEKLKRKAEAEKTPWSVSSMVEIAVLALVRPFSEEDAVCPVCGNIGEAFVFGVDESVQFRCLNKHGPQGIPLTWMAEAKKVRSAKK